MSRCWNISDDSTHTIRAASITTRLIAVLQASHQILPCPHLNSHSIMDAHLEEDGQTSWSGNTSHYHIPSNVAKSDIAEEVGFEGIVEILVTMVSLS